MNTQNLAKQHAALAALDYLHDGDIVGVGTGSTVNFFIEALVARKDQLAGVVASSQITAQRLKQLGFMPLTPNQVTELAVYVDGADEIDCNLRMIKGGGAALTGEKIVASLAKKFICIADQTKYVQQLGKFPLPLEVLSFAQQVVANNLKKMGGVPKLRSGIITDYGNPILDVTQLDFQNPELLEQKLNQLPGVITNGIFAQRAADLLLLGLATGVEIIQRS